MLVKIIRLRLGSESYAKCDDNEYIEDPKIIPEWSSGFPYFIQFKSEFGNKEFMI